MTPTFSFKRLISQYSHYHLVDEYLSAVYWTNRIDIISTSVQIIDMQRSQINFINHTLKHLISSLQNCKSKTHNIHPSIVCRSVILESNSGNSIYRNTKLNWKDLSFNRDDMSLDILDIEVECALLYYPLSTKIIDSRLRNMVISTLFRK